MGKVVFDAVLDAALKDIADNANKLFICSAEPANYTEASSTYLLASVDLTTGDGNGDYTIANGDTSGRKLTVAAQSGITVTNTGTATHIALCDSVNSAVKVVTTCNSQVVTSGNTINLQAFDYEINDPA
jgi:hypothetical protein